MWRVSFGRGFGPVVRQTTELMNDKMVKNIDVSMSLIIPSADSDFLV
jgi:hypothetical protein